MLVILLFKFIFSHPWLCYFSSIMILVHFLEQLSITCRDLEVTASGDTGATVTYQVFSSGGTLPRGIECSPPSGNLFSISTTRHTVTCTATDAASTEKMCTFSVQVNGKFYQSYYVFSCRHWFYFITEPCLSLLACEDRKWRLHIDFQI